MRRTLVALLLWSSLTVLLIGQEELPPISADDHVCFVTPRMPRFPGCEDEATQVEKDVCAREAFKKYIYDHLQYPEEAMQLGLEGVCYFLCHRKRWIGRLCLHCPRPRCRNGGGCCCRH